jgi:large subunit ribosomal protein L1
MANEENFIKAIEELKADDTKKRNFDQTVDLIINLKEFDVRKQAFSLFIQVPNKIKDKKIAGFLEKNSKIVDTIKKETFVKYKEKKELRKLIKSYDYFIANAKLMPAVATSFGRVLGPAGKMPNPQLGILPNEEDKAIEEVIKKINSTVKIKVKEPSIKVSIGKQSMDNEKIMQNALIVYKKVLETLPRKIDNIKNVKIKFTMSKPVKVDYKNANQK